MVQINDILRRICRTGSGKVSRKSSASRVVKYTNLVLDVEQIEHSQEGDQACESKIEGVERPGINIEERGFLDRIDTFSINFLDKMESFPKGFDVIWMSQFLDCFSEEEIVTILQRAKAGMTTDTEMFIMETFWDDQKYPASTYSLHATSLYFTCMANGNSRMYHSDDMRKLVEKAGLFIEKEFCDIGVSHTLFRCKRK